MGGRWNVLAVVHERSADSVEATLHVVPAATRDLFDHLKEKPGP
jgi:hypothetical protein